MSSAQHRTAKRFEERVAADLQRLGIPVVRVHRESWGESCPDVVQVDSVDFGGARPFWSLVSQRTLGPLCVECKTRRHTDIPGYLVKAVKAFVMVRDTGVEGRIERQIPEWLIEMVEQAKGYGQPLWFVVIRKKRGKGKGAGAVTFAICDELAFTQQAGFYPIGARWHNLVVMPFDGFLYQLKYWWRSQHEKED
jgi:hypothetical protein